MISVSIIMQVSYTHFPTSFSNFRRGNKEQLIQCFFCSVIISDTIDLWTNAIWFSFQTNFYRQICRVLLSFLVICRNQTIHRGFIKHDICIVARNRLMNRNIFVYWKWTMQFFAYFRVFWLGVKSFDSVHINFPELSLICPILNYVFSLFLHLLPTCEPNFLNTFSFERNFPLLQAHFVHIEPIYRFIVPIKVHAQLCLDCNSYTRSLFVLHKFVQFASLLI